MSSLSIVKICGAPRYERPRACRPLNFPVSNYSIQQFPGPLVAGFLRAYDLVESLSNMLPAQVEISTHSMQPAAMKATMGRHRVLRPDRVASNQSVTPQTDIKYAAGSHDWKLLLPLSPSRLSVLYKSKLSWLSYHHNSAAWKGIQMSKL